MKTMRKKKKWAHINAAQDGCDHSSVSLSHKSPFLKERRQPYSGA